ncbi:MAG: right-handed parallel beta-helix repeat-containing protein [Paracoccaceae bacterium]
MTPFKSFLTTLCAAALVGTGANAADITITGAKSSGGLFSTAMSGSGATQEYATFDEARRAGAIRGGDTVYFAPGSHGSLVVRDLKFTSPITLTSAPDARAHFEFISISNSSNITVKGFDIWPTGIGDGAGAVLRAVETTDAIIVEDVDIRSVAKADAYPGWTKTQWLDNKRNGILLQGANSIVRNSRVTAAFNGIAVQGPNSLIENSTVNGFSGDGLRALGNDSTIRNNSVADCVKVSDSHNDGIQSWSADEADTLFLGTLKGITLENNNIREWKHQTISPLRCSLQGIFISGYLDGLKIRNNVILVTAWHGIGIYGASNSEITHNTVVHPRGYTDRKPWIRIEPGRDGRSSENILIANNIATSVKSGKTGIHGLESTNNITPTNMSAEFNALASGDVELRLMATAIDAGSAEFATTETDIRGDVRIKGRAPDAGAFETK